MTEQGSANSNGISEDSVDFSQLILGFSSAALHYMGEAQIEGQAAPARNLPLAKQNIDIVRMLREKTRGNLTQDESKLVEQLLSDLQLKFVEAKAKG